MGAVLDRDAIDRLAAELFAGDHPDRLWNGEFGRLGAASAFEKAVYRGFATGRISAAEAEAQAGKLAALTKSAPRSARRACA